MTEACGFDLGSTAARSSTSRSRLKAPIAQQGANCAVNVRQHAHFHLGGGVKTTQALLHAGCHACGMALQVLVECLINHRATDTGNLVPHHWNAKST